MATATSPDIEWVLHVDARARHEELFSILRPTSPFRTAATIRRAWEQLLALGDRADSIRAVEPVRQHPGKMWTLDGELMRPLLPQPDDGVPTYSTPDEGAAARLRAELEPGDRLVARPRAARVPRSPASGSPRSSPRAPRASRSTTPTTSSGPSAWLQSGTQLRRCPGRSAADGPRGAPASATSLRYVPLARARAHPGARRRPGRAGGRVRRRLPAERPVHDRAGRLGPSRARPSARSTSSRGCTWRCWARATATSRRRATTSPGLYAVLAGARAARLRPDPPAAPARRPARPPRRGGDPGGGDQHRLARDGDLEGARVRARRPARSAARATSTSSPATASSRRASSGSRCSRRPTGACTRSR